MQREGLLYPLYPSAGGLLLMAYIPLAVAAPMQPSVPPWLFQVAAWPP